MIVVFQLVNEGDEKDSYNEFNNSNKNSIKEILQLNYKI